MSDLSQAQSKTSAALADGGTVAAGWEQKIREALTLDRAKKTAVEVEAPDINFL